MSRVMKAVPLVVLCVLIIAVPSVWAYWVQDGVALCTATGDRQNLQITSDDAGGAIVTWQDWRSGNSDVYAQRVNASGDYQWTWNGVGLCTASGAQGNPTIVSDGAGGAIVTWDDTRSGADDIYAQRVNASGAVEWTADGVPLSTATGAQRYPQIISDGAGGAIVTWDDTRSGAYDIYAQRVNASGAVQWTADGVALCTAWATQEFPQITSDGGCGAVVTWMDFRNGYTDIYAQRVNASGDYQWTWNGVGLCTASGAQGNPTIVSDGAGGAIVIWQDLRSGNLDIYAQRVDASGAVQWTANGAALCTAMVYEWIPQIASDAMGGAIIAWSDNRRWGNDDIYAQRVSASGVVQWTADGVALCTTTGNQACAGITSDGVGGAIIAWCDNRSGTYSDIYAQRVNASGAVRWTTDGVAVCTAPGNQRFHQIASDDAGGAIVTWMDYRSEISPDIYAQRVDANGFVPLTATDAPAVPAELHQNYPNPFNPATTVTYSISEKCSVSLKIYDVSGKCTACLVDRQQEKGSYAVEWNGKDENGNLVASGIYLCRLAAGNQTISRKILLLR